ncbi:MAG: prepilin peptidase [Alphaproteobacteria bacterium]|nr:prepilin peptidase [Alphaproteobacteria bacterium]
MPPLFYLHLLSLALCMGLLLFAAAGDIKSYRIPNAISIALIALYPIFVLSAPYPVPLLSSLVVAGAALGLGLCAYGTGRVGGGDIKLLSATMLFAGQGLALEFVLITALAGGAVSLVLIHRPMRLGLAFALDHIGSRTLRDALLTEAIPYGVAIAAGGIYVTLRLVGLAADAAP